MVYIYATSETVSHGDFIVTLVYFYLKLSPLCAGTDNLRFSTAASQW